MSDLQHAHTVDEAIELVAQWPHLPCGHAANRS